MERQWVLLPPTGFLMTNNDDFYTWVKAWQHLIGSVRRVEVILPNFYTGLDFPYVTKILTKDFQNQSYNEWIYCVVFLYTYVCALYYIFVCAEMDGSASLENLRSLAMQGDDRTKSKVNFRTLDSPNCHQITAVPKFILAHFLGSICFYYCLENRVGREWLGWK